MEQKFHTPEGVRDIYGRECESKLALQKKLNTVLHLYGYQDIQTPTFEYYDVFREEIGSADARELYKFFDRDGSILALRPDITPSVARTAATLFEKEDFPLRLCYKGNTFINHSSYQGRLKETTQIGAELIGLDSVEADAELAAMVADCLKKSGLKEFQISIGHVDFFQSLLDAAGLSDEQNEELRSLISNRNFFGAEELLDGCGAGSRVREMFHILPELAGGVEILDAALKLAPDSKAKHAVMRLQQIYRLLKLYHAADHITFDMSMAGTYGYYTGIIFRAYTYGTGDAVVSGGRYDHLLEKFGKSIPSIGFAVILDELMSALRRQNITVGSVQRNLIVYTEETEEEALRLARNFRAAGRNIELLRRENIEGREQYESYAERKSMAAVLYLRDDGRIDMLNLRTGEEKTVNTEKPD